jgi:hypothetical protein
VSPSVDGERDSVASFREKEAQPGDHLAPSPMAAATRLTDPEGTSKGLRLDAAGIPGLVHGKPVCRRRDRLFMPTCRAGLIATSIAAPRWYPAMLFVP